MRGQKPTPSFSYTIAGQKVALGFPDDYVAHSSSQPDVVNVNNSEIVFVGYGVQAPEYGWDDYKGVDVRGKTILMLINDPAIPDPAHPDQLDPAMFKGRAMTYYGRWTYKYEIAARLGAAAAIIIHETRPAPIRGTWCAAAAMPSSSACCAKATIRTRRRCRAGSSWIKPRP